MRRVEPGPAGAARRAGAVPVAAIGPREAGNSLVDGS